jgi:hypothetical protein
LSTKEETRLRRGDSSTERRLAYRGGYLSTKEETRRRREDSSTEGETCLHVQRGGLVCTVGESSVEGETRLRRGKFSSKEGETHLQNILF